MTSNRHLVDLLAETRAQIKELQAREATLKDSVIDMLSQRPMLGETQSVDGDEFRAAITLSESERLDRKAVEKMLPPSRFAKCLKTSTSITVRVAPRARLEEAA